MVPGRPTGTTRCHRPATTAGSAVTLIAALVPTASARAPAPRAASAWDGEQAHEHAERAGPDLVGQQRSDESAGGHDDDGERSGSGERKRDQRKAGGECEQAQQQPAGEAEQRDDPELLVAVGLVRHRDQGEQDGDDRGDGAQRGGGLRAAVQLAELKCSRFSGQRFRPRCG